MASRANAKKMTYADYALIPADGKRHEIIEGAWYMTPAPEVPHQRVSRKIEALLDAHVTRHRLGEVFDAPIDVVIADEDVVQPDIIFVSTARAEIVTQKNVRGAPDLVVEILSVSTAAIDRGEKRRLYERAGVREYWIVDPAAQSVEIHEFASPRRTRVYTNGQSFESALLPGLTVKLAEIF
jgi:Uma2 family endonuclease